MMQQGIDPSAPLAVTMTAQEWERVLQILGDAPFKQVSPLIQAIVSQCMDAKQLSSADSFAQS